MKVLCLPYMGTSVLVCKGQDASAESQQVCNVTRESEPPPRDARTPLFIDFASRRRHKGTWSSSTVAAMLPPSVGPQAFTSSGMSPASLRTAETEVVGSNNSHSNEAAKRYRATALTGPAPGQGEGATVWRQTEKIRFSLC
jgi:hypothetical protein